LNIIVSSWPGAGASTLAMILAKELKLKLFLGTETFRLIGKKLDFEDTGAERIKADLYLEKYWGPLYDKFVKHVATSDDGLVIDSDIGGFKVKNNNTFSFFLTASFKSRSDRLSADNREKDIKFLKLREKTLQKTYKHLYNIDWLDKEAIKKNYSLLIDNSKKTIQEELKDIYNFLAKQGVVPIDDINILIKFMKNTVETFWEKGKDGILRDLENKNLLVKPEEIIIKMRSIYSDEIRLFPKILHEILTNF
jgi:cytidylate kinase